MAVNLSPVAGAAAQFFDNSGNVLTGGKLYTYDAGTTTPAVTYTNSSGVTAHPNPIVLNAAGRVPDSGEIWLSDNVSYKFVLKDQNDVLIATWDNLSGINSNFVAFTGKEETQTATQGQTVFTLVDIEYQPENNNLLVFVNGSKQVPGDNFVETSSTVVTFVDGLNVGDVVDFCTATPINTSTAVSVSFGGFKGQVGNVQNLADDDGSDWIGFLPDGANAVAISAQDKMRQTVNANDFGAVGDGVTDDTAAVQDAIDYCLANHKDLMINGRCLITASLNIDKPVDDPTYDEYFTILSVNNGGFIVNTAIAMFSSTIPFTTAPVVALVRFQNLVFECSNSALAAYVLDNARFLRTVFTGCSFSKIKCLTASVVYTQSIYFFECNVRRVVGTFFDSGVFTYDFKMVGCLVEAVTGSALRLNNPVGCSIVSSCIEGISGTAIIYDGAQALDVTGCYFEANGLDIDGTDSGASSSVSYGVCLNGNYFSNSTTTYTVKWGAMSSGCISIGNWHTGYMHDITAGSDGLVTFDTAQSSLSNDPTIQIIQGGYSGTFTGTLTGCTTSPTGTLRFNRVGSDVTLYIPTITGTSNSSACEITGLPSYLIPVRQQIFVGRIKNNSADAFGLFIINDGTGVISLGSDAAGTPFVASGTKGSTVTTITYSVN